MDYIGVETIRALIAEIGLVEAIDGIARAIEQDYRRWDAFDKSPRHAVHSCDGVIELMPTSDGAQYAFKYVNGHPKNTARGLLTVTAFGVLADVATGYPVLLSELTLTTAMRTAAMSALAARTMARPDSPVMALIGNGAQAEFQAIAFHRVGIETLRLHDVDAAATRKLERNLKRVLPATRVVRCASVADAMNGADIVTTITADKRNATIVTPDLVRPGMHLNAVGGDCPGKTELHRDILLRPDARIVVEYAPQTRIEGEIQQLDPDFPVIEFADLLRGRHIARRGASDVTIFDSVGFALEDFSALRYLHRALASRPHLRSHLDLLPEPRDPKDLFALFSSDDATERSIVRRFDETEVA